MSRPKGWRRQGGRHAVAARKGWENRRVRRAGGMIQTGRTHREIDKKLTARRPGKRMSRHHKKYYEYRQNRSDASRTRRL